MRSWIEKLFGRCGRWLTYPKRRRMNTAYVDDEANFSTECGDCFAQTQEYWAELWDDYYSGLL